jgi:uncharacterized membrane protein YsdA (DUF1294 family)/cold shock CspA family protein
LNQLAAGHIELARRMNKGMRYQGQITKWKDDQGFGFITPDGGGKQVFVHIKSFSNRQRRPIGNEFVTYELNSDEQGRNRAEHVAFVDDTPAIPTQRRTTVLALPALFIAFVALSVFMGKLPFVVLGLYLAASLVTFLVYASDKSAAKRDQRRTSEGTLHVLALIGGWPGAFVAQGLLRHKSKKLSFRIVFWTTVVLNCIGLLWLFSPGGSDALHSLVGRLSYR